MVCLCRYTNAQHIREDGYATFVIAMVVGDPDQNRYPERLHPYYTSYDLLEVALLLWPATTITSDTSTTHAVVSEWRCI